MITLLNCLILYKDIYPLQTGHSVSGTWAEVTAHYHIFYNPKTNKTKYKCVNNKLQQYVVKNTDIN